MSRRLLIAGNWKMNHGVADSLKFFAAFKRSSLTYHNIEVLVCPPHTSLYSCSVALADTDIMLGAQNCHEEPNGAFTGEVSADFLEELGCQYVIVGHSERRKHFKEGSDLLARKLVRVYEAGMTPIFCVGETKEERAAGKTEAVIEAQIKEGFKSLTEEQMGRTIIAYEPVWAIGTGDTATPEQAQEVHLFIRRLIGQVIGHNRSLESRILYGGSVKPENARDLLSQTDIDGALVGGASLEADDFIQIIQAALG